MPTAGEGAGADRSLAGWQEVNALLVVAPSWMLVVDENEEWKADASFIVRHPVVRCGSPGNPVEPQ